MPSPFPGMDPYLEAPDIWPDFHDAFASEIRALLNQTLPAPYYARLEMRPEIGVVEEDDNPRRVIPDIAVVRHPRPHFAAALGRFAGDIARRGHAASDTSGDGCGMVLVIVGIIGYAAIVGPVALCYLGYLGRIFGYPRWIRDRA